MLLVFCPQSVTMVYNGFLPVSGTYSWEYNKTLLACFTEMHPSLDGPCGHLQRGSIPSSPPISVHFSIQGQHCDSGQVIRKIYRDRAQLLRSWWRCSGRPYKDDDTTIDTITSTLPGRLKRPDNVLNLKVTRWSIHPVPYCSATQMSGLLAHAWANLQRITLRSPASKDGKGLHPIDTMS